MSFKIIKFLLLSALFCSIVIAATLTSTNLYQISATTIKSSSHPNDNGHPSVMLIGDPVPPGGWPRCENQTR
jgi:hypothetical protein